MTIARTLITLTLAAQLSACGIMTTTPKPPPPPPLRRRRSFARRPPSW